MYHAEVIVPCATGDVQHSLVIRLQSRLRLSVTVDPFGSPAEWVSSGDSPVAHGSPGTTVRSDTTPSVAEPKKNVDRCVCTVLG
jgi:hypothetical protein